MRRQNADVAAVIALKCTWSCKKWDEVPAGKTASRLSRQANKGFAIVAQLCNGIANIIQRQMTAFFLHPV